MEKQDKQPNHLQGQTSPYLLQHLYNPVNWYPWGEKALEKAKASGKPLLVSIGYSACHWCHVMEKESFEDEEVARIMNEHFVCIKVDREERPDVDHLYMNAVQLLEGHGGWPLNCFALPDGRPFWGGTYFPRQQWMQILQRVAQVYSQQREQVEEQAGSLTEGVARSSLIAPSGGQAAFSPDEADRMYENIMKYMDLQQGGRRGAPKFPMPINYEFLLNYHYHTSNQPALEQVMLSLRKMAMGGIYDQIGGGFARYSVDDQWKVPHFEKMLYDNAQLISLYSQAWKLEHDPLFREVVQDTIQFVDRELSSPEGTFYSALDADSEGEEGKYYVWTLDQLKEVLAEDEPLVSKYFHAGGKGFWEKGKNILLRTQTDEEFAVSENLDPGQWKQIISRSRQKLLLVREQRLRPGLDHKVLVSWNGLMIRALCDAGTAFADNSYLEKACRAADHILQYAMEPSGKLYRTLHHKKASIDGFLEDYAFLIRGLISLYQAGADASYLEKAALLTRYVMNAFHTEGSTLFSFSSAEGEQLAAPYFDFHDTVIPSGNSMMACNLFYLGQYFEQPGWSKRSSQMLGDMKKLLDKYSGSYSNWGVLLMHHVFPFYSLAICGPEAAGILGQAAGRFLPNVIVSASQQKEDIPLMKGRCQPGQTWLYLCQAGTCQLPVRSFQQVLQQIRAR